MASDQAKSDETPETDSDGNEQPRMYSPVCSVCWWWKPADKRSCAAYLRPNSIPLAIWNGRNKHMAPYPGDHGIILVLDPDAEQHPPSWAKNALRVGSPAAKAMLAKSEQMKAQAKAAKSGKKEST